MGILGKLAFWRKRDEFKDIEKDLDKDLGLDAGGISDLGLESQEPHKYPSFQSQPSGGFQPYQISQPSFQQPTMPYHQMSDQEYINSKNLEVISSKLDALKASLESISHRLANIEAMAKGEEEEKRRRYY